MLHGVLQRRNLEGESCSWLGKNAQFFRNTMKFQLCKDVSHGDPVLPRQMDYERFMFDSLVYAPPKKAPPGNSAQLPCNRVHTADSHADRRRFLRCRRR